MKKILGLDLGTNSIGWALYDKENKKILGMGSRIIPMGSEKLDYEKGKGITKNAERRAARSVRRMGKRYKMRRNKLLFVLNELEICPDQFKFRYKVRDNNGKLTDIYNDGFPKAKNIQDLELLPIKKGTLQLNSIEHFQLRVNAITKKVNLKDFGKILYKFNQLRGYSGGSYDEDNKNKIENLIDDPEEITQKKYEVITQKVEILQVKKSDKTFKAKSGENKGKEFNCYDITVNLNNEEINGTTTLQTLEAGKEEELEIRIKRTKKGEDISFTLPQKTNWRKQLESTEEILKSENLFVGELLLKDLKESKWKKIRNRVFLRNRYKLEFDKIWEIQANEYPILNNVPLEKLEIIAAYLFPGKSESQVKLRRSAIDGGLKYIIKEQIIYYQRPLKSQTDLIRKCKFETNETVIANTHPLFQEFRCWEQINKMYITSKIQTYNEKKKKTVYKYTDRYLTNDQKNEIYRKLQIQKNIGFSEVAKIIGLKMDKSEYLNGLNVKAKLKGCDTIINIKNILGDFFEELIQKDEIIFVKLWDALYNKTGNEYDINSDKVKALKDILNIYLNNSTAEEIALKLAINIKYPRKYSDLSSKAINRILPLLNCTPLNEIDFVKEKLEKIKQTIETGEINDEDTIESNIINYINNNPDLINSGGMMYSFATSMIYGKHSNINVIPSITNYHEIIYNKERNLRNPVVEQITNETMQVIKAIWKKYKFNPDELEIRVELARDLKNSAEERASIYKAYITNQRINESIKKKLIEIKQAPTQKNITQYKLWSLQRIEDYPKQSKEPTIEEINKLRIWEEQKCISPYTLKPIPLSKLFSDKRLYDIDHIIPKSRFFDDSLTNQVVCETNINEEKGNRTAWEYISQQNSKFEICSVESFIMHTNRNFHGRKKRNLLIENIPANIVERQIKDTQYLSTAVKNELAKIVGSENVKTTTGEVTAFLRSRWGLRKLFMELTESRFKQMELWDWNKDTNTPNSILVLNYYDEVKKMKIYEIKNWSKRYDHRHHSIDALVVALTEQKDIQRLNNLNKELQNWLTNNKKDIDLNVGDGETILEAYFNLDEEKRNKIQKKIEGFKVFEKPIPDLLEQVNEFLSSMVISHKPKDNLSIQKNEITGKKELKIRSALHEATFYGKHNGKDTKTVSISNLTVKEISKITDGILKNEIDSHRKKYESMKEAFTGEGLKFFNENRFQRKKPTELKPPVYKIKIYYSTMEKTESSLQRLYENNDKLSVKTGGNYLFIVMEKEVNNKIKRVFEIVSLYDAARIAKDELMINNENFKKRICEDYRLNHKEKPDKVLFTLQQNELVYFPENEEDPVLNFTKSEFEEWISNSLNKCKFAKRIYKVVKFSGKDCNFIPHIYANTISISKDLTDEQMNSLKTQYKDKKIPKKELNFEEFGSYGNSARTEVNESFVRELVFGKSKNNINAPLKKIQDYCIKIKIDWLGNINLPND
ncbi:MAG TPA: type II CRISPR RNA-guided endonuclease Cas9 [Ignavibacteria bacterium]|nr:type II CRISPR RNA-guided endonuclease Cas9 [Ignavibacteria bacterium]